MDPILQKFKAKFLDEAQQLLDQLEKIMLELENNTNSKVNYQAAFRIMHTLKGTSSMYGYESITHFTHQMESLYQYIRDEKIFMSKDIIDLTFQSIDHIRNLLHDQNFENPNNKLTHKDLLRKVAELLTFEISSAHNKQSIEINNDKAEKIKKSFQILIRTDEQLYFRGINLVNIFHDLSELGEFNIKHIKHLSNNNSDWWDIIFITDKTIEDIKEVLMFIDDNCVITCLTDKDIFHDDIYLNIQQEEKSILDIIENQEYFKKTNSSTETIQKANVTEAKSNKKATERISVDASKLDYLMYLVSELITVNAQLNISTHDKMYDYIRPYIEKLDNLSKQFRNNALEIRLVPLADMVLRFQRLIRDLSKQLGKKILLKTQGVETELDKSTIEHLYEPLMHIIRNCIDHGIEVPEIRQKKGKSEEGIITISAVHNGNCVIIKIQDDGCGIDTEKICRKAIEKGIWPENYKPNEKEIYDLIFLPGFSTAQSLTEVSGRGVGMDIVLKKIQDLRGNIEITSKREVGTCFTIYLQQSVAIIDTLLFQIDSKYFIIPISDILICEQIESKELEKHYKTRTIPFQNQLIPFINLREYFSFNDKPPAKQKLILVHVEKSLIAIMADKIIGEHQAVLKPLGRLLRNHKYVTAASQMGDGNIAFLLNINELFKSLQFNNQLCTIN